MRKKKATRYNAQQEHASYGIYNWFKLTGIDDQQIMMEVMGYFCINNGFAIDPKTKEQTIINFVQNRFQKFCPFAKKYLIENNYLP